MDIAVLGKFENVALHFFTLLICSEWMFGLTGLACACRALLKLQNSIVADADYALCRVGSDYSYPAPVVHPPSCFLHGPQPTAIVLSTSRPRCPS